MDPVGLTPEEWNCIRAIAVAAVRLRLRCSPDAAEDAVQRAILEIWDPPRTHYRDRAHFQSALCQIASRRAIDAWRRESRLEQFGEDPLGAPGDANSIPAFAEDVCQLFGTLTDEQQQVVRRKYLATDSPITDQQVGLDLWPQRQTGHLARAHRVRKEGEAALYHVLLNAGYPHLQRPDLPELLLVVRNYLHAQELPCP